MSNFKATEKSLRTNSFFGEKYMLSIEKKITTKHTTDMKYYILHNILLLLQLYTKSMKRWIIITIDIRKNIKPKKHPMFFCKVS